LASVFDDLAFFEFLVFLSLVPFDFVFDFEPLLDPFDDWLALRAGRARFFALAVSLVGRREP